MPREVRGAMFPRLKRVDELEAIPRSDRQDGQRDERRWLNAGLDFTIALLMFGDSWLGVKLVAAGLKSPISRVGVINCRTVS